MAMFVNPFLKQEEWIKQNKSCFKLLDDFGVGVAVISSKMEILALNKVTKKWFPNINVGERPICYKSFNIPPRDDICEYCPTIKTLTDGKVHEAITETPVGDKIINYRVVSSPVKDEKQLPAGKTRAENLKYRVAYLKFQARARDSVL